VTGAEKLSLLIDPSDPATQMSTDAGEGNKITPIFSQEVKRNFIFIYDPSGLLCNCGLEEGRFSEFNFADGTQPDPILGFVTT